MGHVAGLAPLPAAAVLLLLLRYATAASLAPRGREPELNERPIVGKGRPCGIYALILLT